MLTNCHVGSLKKNFGHSVGFTPMTSQIVVKNYTPLILTLTEPYPLKSRTNQCGNKLGDEVCLRIKHLPDTKTTSIFFQEASK